MFYTSKYNNCTSQEILKPIFRSQKYFWSKLPGTRRKEIFYNNFINKAKDIGEEFHKFMVQEKGIGENRWCTCMMRKEINWWRFTGIIKKINEFFCFLKALFYIWKEHFPFLLKKKSVALLTFRNREKYNNRENYFLPTLNVLSLYSHILHFQCYPLF